MFNLKALLSSFLKKDDSRITESVLEEQPIPAHNAVECLPDQEKEQVVQLTDANTMILEECGNLEHSITQDTSVIEREIVEEFNTAIQPIVNDQVDAAAKQSMDSLQLPLSEDLVTDLPPNNDMVTDQQLTMDHKLQEYPTSFSAGWSSFDKNTAIAHYLFSHQVIAPEQLGSFVAAAPFCYMRYEIPKRHHRGFRVIAQPSKDLKIVQRSCVRFLREKLPIHDKAMAYEAGRDIKQNAQLHSKHNYLLKMDFKDFFASITPFFFRKVVEQHHEKWLSEDDFILLSRLLFWRPIRHSKRFELSIGAPSSPFISNVVMFFFDKAIDAACIKQNICYSRYADDLTFSTSHKQILFTVPALVERYLKQYCFDQLVINPTKTVFSSKQFNRHITGITLTNNNKLSLGRAKKRYLKSLVYKFTLHQLTSTEVEKLAGYIAYATYIEPSFVNSLMIKYGSSTLQEIFQLKGSV